MAWVSYLEDIIERFNDFINEHSSLADNSGDISHNQKEAVKALLHQCHNIISEAEKHLDIATDPNLDLAHENVKLSEKLRKEAGKVEALEKQSKEFHLRLLEANGVIKGKDKELSEVKAKYDKLERDYEKSFKSNPEGAYDHYSKSGRANKYKEEVS